MRETNTTMPDDASRDPTILGPAQIDGLLSGNTVYIAVPPGVAGGEAGGMAAFRYGMDGTASAALPNGTVLAGRWRIDGASYCADWDNGAKDSRSRLVRDGATIAIVDPATGARRGAIDHVRPGNPERF